MKTLSSTLFFVFALFPVAVSAQSWMDRSHTIFLPHSIQKPLSAQMEFPSFWWNFIVIEPTPTHSPDFKAAARACDALAPSLPALIQKTACPDLKALLPLIESWSHDVFKRHYAPPFSEIDLLLKDAETKIAMSFGSDLLNILRTDPLESYRDLQELLVKNVSLGFDKENGFFVDRNSQRIILPVQFSFSPQESEKTRKSLELIPKDPSSLRLQWVGPHIAALENETQVLKDVEMVSVFGTILLVLQLAFVFATRRLSYLWLIPPMAAGIAGAVIFTVIIYGSIHGLTISLGTGLIALALDFGLHSVHNIRWNGVWRANLFGLLTTYAGLLAISLSAIPLLRQMMVFAAIGLTLSYFFYYMFHTRYPQLVQVRPFTYTPVARPWKTVVALIFVIVGIVGSLVLRPNLSMQQFDSQSEKTRSTLIWLYSHIHQRAPLFSVRPINDSAFKEAHEQLAWARSQSISATNFATYLSPPEVQRQKQLSWQQYCRQLSSLTSTHQTLFAPFIKTWPCTNEPSPQTLSPPPLYIKDLVSRTQWITTWFPENDTQTQAIKNYDTNAFALGEVLREFPNILAHELLWMVPLSLLTCLFLAWLYYRKLWLSTLSLLPFATGVGTYFLCVILFGWGYSFISVIGLIMVFGLSIDYGLFAANLYLLDEPPPAEGVWSCLVLAATVTILGFLPLAFCTHPVLVHLGQTLVMGSIGTWIGTVWGIPGIFMFLQREKK